MKIVIVGNGKVGFAIARQLDHEGHDVTIIESKAKILENTMNLIDVVGVQGNGANVEVLKQAKVSSADVLIAATSSDEINIICCMISKKLGTKHTIARVRNIEYLEGLRLLKDELGLSLTINPELAAATELLRALRFSSSIKVSSFAKGRLELAEIKIREGNPLINYKLNRINHDFRSNVLFCAIQRGNDVIIPNGESYIRLNDKITLTGSTMQLEYFFQKIGILQNRKIQEVMIVGGGRITFYLTKMLLELGIDVKIIEINKDRCLQLVERFPNATVIHGDGTDHELLISESLEEMDAFVALTDNDEENVIISMFASSHGVSRVLPKVNRMSLGFLLEKLGLENSITPKHITANQIVQYIRAMQNSLGSNVESLIKIINDHVEVLEFRVRENCRFLNKPLKDLTLKPGILVCYISRKGISKIAVGDSHVQVGDNVIIISQLLGLRDINDVLA